MVQEVRDIMLSMDEVKDAFIGYQRIAPDFLPKGTIVACGTADESVVLSIELGYGGVPQKTEFVFKGLDVLKPLIRYCIENNIMLPRDGKKSILYRDDKILMHIELNLGADAPAMARPLAATDKAKTDAITPQRILAAVAH